MLLIGISCQIYFFSTLNQDLKDCKCDKEVTNTELNIENSTSILNTTKKEAFSNLETKSITVSTNKNRLKSSLINDSELVGFSGGAWTAETHLSKYGFNVDWGLMEVLESSCRDIENSRIPEGVEKWEIYKNADPLHPLTGWWKPPKKKHVNCKVLEIGCGVGVYADALKKEIGKIERTVIGIEPNSMGGAFNRGKFGPKQLAIDILKAKDQTQLARQIRDTELGGKGFDLIYSIEVFEHMPLDRHADAFKFIAASARRGTKLIFGAAHPNQKGVGHIGGRRNKDWERMLSNHGFILNVEETGEAKSKMQEYNHRINTGIYYYQRDN